MIKKHIYLIFILLLSSPILAHDTSKTHPLITGDIQRSIKAEQDSLLLNNYQEPYGELYVSATLNIDTDYWELPRWGFPTANYSNFQEAYDDNCPFYDLTCLASSLYTPFKNPEYSVMHGVIYEDEPATNAGSHFYHAFTGSGFLNNESSRERALKLITNSIFAFGYESAADDLDLTPIGSNGIINGKDIGFFYFGQALHHVQDMGSVPHIIGDTHIDIYDKELSDYEGIYIPRLLFEDTSGIGNDDFKPRLHVFKEDPLENPTAYTKSINTLLEIWPSPIESPSGLICEEGTLSKSDSLARAVYNFSVFQGDLEYPPCIVDVDTTETEKVVTCFTPDTPSIINGSGEISEMFCEETDIIDEKSVCINSHIRWNPFSLWSDVYWEIDRVGKYYYLDVNKGLFGSDWWETSEHGGPAKHFYIEELIEEFDVTLCVEGGVPGCTNHIPDNHLLIPNQIREAYQKPFDSTTNKMKLNDIPLVQKMVNNIVPIAVKYGAAFSKYWYDMANMPPYLKQVKIFVGGDLIYNSKWRNIKHHGSVNINKSGLVFDHTDYHSFT